MCKVVSFLIRALFFHSGLIAWNTFKYEIINPYKIDKYQTLREMIVRLSLQQSEGMNR